MAKVRATPTNISDLINDWAASPTNRGDELIFIQGAIDSRNIQQDAFNSNAKMIIKVQPDIIDPFMKMTFVEILS